jgi:hypothetical protein
MLRVQGRQGRMRHKVPTRYRDVDGWVTLTLALRTRDAGVAKDRADLAWPRLLNG